MIYSDVKALQRHCSYALAILALCFQTPAVAQNVTVDDDVLGCSVQYQELGICEAGQSAFDAINGVTASPSQVTQNQPSQKSPAHNAFNDVENWKSKALFDAFTSDKRQELYTYNLPAAANAHLLSICAAHPIEQAIELNRSFYREVLNESAVQLIMGEFNAAIENDRTSTDLETDCSETHTRITYDWYRVSKSLASSALSEARLNLEYRKWKGSDRVQTARLEACKSVMNDSDTYQNIMAAALSDFPAIGPPEELYDRCQFYFTGGLDQLRKRKSELRN